MRPYRCSYCARSYKSRQSMKEHEYQCPYKSDPVQPTPPGSEGFPFQNEAGLRNPMALPCPRPSTSQPAPALNQLGQLGARPPAYPPANINELLALRARLMAPGAPPPPPPQIRPGFPGLFGNSIPPIPPTTTPFNPENHRNGAGMGGTHALALHIRRLLANAVQQQQQGGIRNPLEKSSLSEATPSSHSSHSSAEDSGQFSPTESKIKPTDINQNVAKILANMVQPQADSPLIPESRKRPHSFESEPTPKRMRSPNPTNLNLADSSKDDEVFVNESPLENSVVADVPPVDDNEDVDVSVEPLDESKNEISSVDSQSPLDQIAQDEHMEIKAQISVFKNGAKLNSWECETCNCIFLNEITYRIHMGVHMHADPLCCNSCGKRCSDQQEFQAHLVHHQHVNNTVPTAPKATNVV